MDSNSVSVSKKARTRQVHTSDDGCIKIHSLCNQDVGIIVPETPGTGRRDPDLTPVKENNFFPSSADRPRTAFITPIRRRREASRPTTMESIMSDQSSHAEVYPFLSSRPTTAGSLHSSFSLSPSSILLQSLPFQEARENEAFLRKRFQTPKKQEECMEGLRKRELSELFYKREESSIIILDSDRAEDKEPRRRYKLYYGRIPEFLVPFDLLPVPPGFWLRCSVTRSRGGIDGKLYPTYYLHLERNGSPGLLLLTARKSNLVRTDYVISTNPAEFRRKGEFCVGIVEADLRGCSFKLKTPIVPPEEHLEFEDDEAEGIELGAGTGTTAVKDREWEQTLSALFEPNQMGVKSPRRLKIALPQMQSDYEAAHPGQFSCSVKEKEGVVDEKEVAHLVNRPPRWSQDTCTFILNFSGRVQVSSVKNFQLMVDDSNDANVLQFGRTSSGSKFILDFGYPFSPVQAFAVALANFDVKWGLD